MYKEELIKITTVDLEKIALWKIYNDENINSLNIFLTHGTFSNRKVCIGIAKYFASIGYTCWIMEWRNHGESSKTTKKFNFETIALFDIKSVFEYLFDELKISALDCITHSGGGICLTMCLIKNEKFISKITSISMFGCQSFGACHNLKNTLKILLSKYISLILGYIPSKRIGLGPHNETYYTMKQWYNWNLKRNFKGDYNFNYLCNMKTIKIPILSICGEGDKFISPKEGVLDFINAFKNKKNNFINCSVSKGFTENYNHSRIIYSKNASTEIWPIVRNWIELAKQNA
jgi:predicted alpha/beta hydrolase